MNAITIHAFPPINLLTSPRSWLLAVIVLLHAGFFWALSNGLSLKTVIDLPRSTVIEFLPTQPRPAPEPPDIFKNVTIPAASAPAPIPPTVVVDEEPQQVAPLAVTTAPPPEPLVRPSPAPGGVVEPQIDPRVGLSEPLYPPAAIRGNESGTVILSVLVLENGRVGAARLVQSSGHARLDEAALREARRWRLKPGARNGAPAAMWKQIPITFRLEDAVRF